MADTPIWQQHPVADTPEAAAAVSGSDGEAPVWLSHDAEPAANNQQPAPAEGYDLYRKATDAMNRGITMGLSDKIGAATLATGHELGLTSPYDAAASDDGWSDAYHKNLDAIRSDADKFTATNPVASRVAEGAGLIGSVAALPSEGALATAGLLPKIAEGAKVGGAAGGMAGFGNSKDESVTGDLAATGAGTAIGAGLGGTGAAAADKVLSPVFGWVAVDLVRTRFRARLCRLLLAG
jgi:hypothetical protein